MNPHQGISEKSKRRAADPNATLDKKAPEAPFALVAIGYLTILALASVAFAVGLWLID